jgi:N-acetylglucosaminyldiphosphoundecaprenol N-acetyl-beta-D-mannosaminyltransferase
MIKTVGETIIIGKLASDFMNLADFKRLAARWLATNSFYHVVTLNPEMVMLAERDEAFKKAAMAAEMRVPDGAGLVWARWYLRSAYWPLWPSLLAFLWQRVERVTGVDAIMELSKLAAAENKKVYLLGGEEADAKATAEKIRREVPGINIALSPPHKFDLKGPTAIVEHINKEGTAVLFVAYGAPRQTEWIEKHRHKLEGVRIAIGVGGAFDILGEKLPRAPLWLRKINLEWVWRLYLEPKRLPRIWQAVVSFPLLMGRYKRERPSRT